MGTLCVLRKGILPRQAVSDAIHASVASSEGIQTLLTWNGRHLANPLILRKLRAFVNAHGLMVSISLALDLPTSGHT
jgi:hypothetical protein